MKKDVLLISSGSTFMVNAIIDNLKGGGYSVTRIDPLVNQISSEKDSFDILVFYLGDFIENISETLVYLKDICVEEDKYLYCIGSKDEISILRKDVPDHAISGLFERPVNIKNLLSALDGLVAEHEGDSKKKSVLVVDDDVVFLNMMKEWLSVDYRVALVNSGMRAITYLANNKPDLILLDYEMPVTSGPQVLEMIRDDSETSDTPVIFLTGKGDRDSVTKVLSLKPNGYLLKNLSKDELLSSVRDFFEKQRANKIALKMI